MAVSKRPDDRTGQVWESKSKFSKLRITITGQEWRQGEHERYHLWTYEAVNVFGAEFTGTISEQILKREHRRVKAGD